MARDQCCRGLGFFCLCVPVPVFLAAYGKETSECSLRWAAWQACLCNSLHDACMHTYCVGVCREVVLLE